jgi:hypothetical protein
MKQRNWAALIERKGMLVQAVSEGNEDGGDFVEGFAADPGLDAEPSAGDEGAEQGGDVGAADAETGAAIDGKGNPIARAGVGVEDHGDQDDGVAERDGEDGLPPVHAFGNQRRGEHVGGDAGRHADPEGGDIERAPFSAGPRRGSDVTVEEGGVGQVLGHFANVASGGGGLRRHGRRGF